MESDGVREVAVELAAERASLRAQMEHARRRVLAIETTLTGLYQLFPDLRPTERAVTQSTAQAAVVERPRGQAAVLAVLSDPAFLGAYWTVAKMTEELSRRGWDPDSDRPANGVRVALARLAESDVRVHKGVGENGHIVYYFFGNGAKPPQFRSPRKVEGESFRS